MDIVEQIKLFLEPKSIALLGISRQTDPNSYNIIAPLLKQGFQGKLYPVNPHTDEIMGVKTYPEVAQIDDEIDLALLFTSREITPKILQECADKGIKAAIIVGQGFNDATDDLGKKLQNDITAIIKKTGIRVLGPNTLGTANAFLNFSLSFAEQYGLEKIPVGLVSQSGIFFGIINELRMLGKGIDLGNGCDVDVTDCLEYYEADPEVKVIALHIEGINNGRKFFKVAKRVAQKKPVIVLKTGRSKQSAKAAQSHSGSIIGKDEIWDALFKQTGLIRAHTIDEMSDLIKLFSQAPPVRGRGVGIASYSGGMGIYTLDACNKYGLNIAEPHSETMEKIVRAAPHWFNVGNPLDLWPIISTSEKSIEESLKDTILAFMENPAIDSVILFLAAWMEDENTPLLLTEIISAIADAFPDKAVVLCPYEGWVHDIDIQIIENKLKKTGKVPLIPTPDRAAKALSTAATYYEFLQNT